MYILIAEKAVLIRLRSGEWGGRKIYFIPLKYRLVTSLDIDLWERGGSGHNSAQSYQE